MHVRWLLLAIASCGADKVEHPVTVVLVPDASRSAPPPASATDASATDASTPDECAPRKCVGSITEDVEAALGQAARATRRKCYEPALASTPTLEGSVKIRLTISENGRICSARSTGETTGMEQVGECTARVIEEIGQVPSPRGCVNVLFPVTFKVRKPDAGP
jgi:hypothetical protein